MKKSFLIISMIGLMLCFPLSAGAKKEKKPKVPKHGISQQINDLQQQIDNIQLTPGPAGLTGPAGVVLRNHLDMIQAQKLILLSGQESVSAYKECGRNLTANF
jgi:hypothetical protein